MSTQDQARALMIRHHHLIKNREQCMLSRAAVEIGLPADTARPWNRTHGDPNSSLSIYDRSNASLS